MQIISQDLRIHRVDTRAGATEDVEITPSTAALVSCGYRKRPQSVPTEHTPRANVYTDASAVDHQPVPCGSQRRVEAANAARHVLGRDRARLEGQPHPEAASGKRLAVGSGWLGEAVHDKLATYIAGYDLYQVSVNGAPTLIGV